MFFWQEGRTYASVSGHESQAGAAAVPEGATFVGIEFAVGTSLRMLSTSDIVDGGVELPDATHRSLRLDGVRWEVPGRTTPRRWSSGSYGPERWYAIRSSPRYAEAPSRSRAGVAMQSG